MKILYIMHSIRMSGSTISFINMLKGLESFGNFYFVVVIPDNCTNKDENLFYSRLDTINAKIVKVPILSLGFKKFPRPFRFRAFFRYIRQWIKAKLKDYQSYHSIKKLVLKEKPDIIHTNVGVIHVGYKVCQELHIPHVWHLREYQDLDFNWVIQPTKSRFEEMLNNSAVITITKDIFNHFHLDNNPLAYVIYNGIFRKSDAEYFFDKEKYFLICSRLSPEKGIIEAVEAFCNFTDNNNEYKLKILGAVNEDNSYHRNIIEIIKHRHKEHLVEFLGFKNDVKPYMKRAKALIVASHHEGFGRMTAEACFMGCLVIGRNTSGTKEILDYTGGIKYDGSIGDLLEKLNYVAGMNRTDYSKMAINAMEKAKAKYSIEANAISVFEVYNKLVYQMGNNETKSL